VIYQHLKNECFTFFWDKIVHRLIDFNSIFYGIFGSLNKAGLRLEVRLVLRSFAKLIKLSYWYALFFNTFFPYFQLLILLFLISFSLFFFFLHAENLIHGFVTSASSGMANGLSYCGVLIVEDILGRLPCLESSSDYLFFIEVIDLIN